MLINKLSSVFDIVEAWCDTADDIFAINEQVALWIDDEKYQTIEELRKLEQLQDVLSEVIDWKFFFKAECRDLYSGN